jgi:hypothetical protein
MNVALLVLIAVLIAVDAWYTRKWSIASRRAIEELQLQNELILKLKCEDSVE